MSSLVKYKNYAYLLILLIFFSLLMVNAKTIGRYAKPYISESIYHILAVIFDNKTSFKKYSNDYNVKFLPKTELLDLNFSKIKINTESNVSGYLTKKPSRTFFLENYNDNLIIFSNDGNISFIKTSILSLSIFLMIDLLFK